MTHGGWADEDADIIAMDEHSALCLAAHEAGSPLWRALVEGTSLEKLVESVSAQYAAAPNQLASDVDELFAVFDARGLLNG
ncbi:PqqD family protein [Solirubrobacter deserti]|uniref:PqqD family protein n=1 Tax=Solirubrobacter deserti TaxID=2282478 RepID=A0ABT4RIG6_9ACTN|nr:PqqD family protein [Solirubrobacter deserti]MDA0138346.1 PqqD family protein [Solirubrobacter deserti]